MSTAGFTILMLAMLALICAVYIPDIVKAFSKKEEAAEGQQSSEHEEEIQRRIAEEVEKLKRQSEQNCENSDVQNNNHSGSNDDV